VFDRQVIEVSDEDLDKSIGIWRCAPKHHGRPLRGHARCIYADSGRVLEIDGTPVRVFSHWADWEPFDSSADWR
jgi:hypothetical protein